jgi:hypothetical protein
VTDVGRQVNERSGVRWFDAPWRWWEDAGNVHSYPHVTFLSPNLPARLDNISSLRLSATWTMVSGNKADGSSVPVFDRAANGGWDSAKGELSRLGTVANVAFDMFADLDPAKCSDPVQADVEIMVWVGSVGSPYPLKHKTLGTQKLGGRE